MPRSKSNILLISDIQPDLDILSEILSEEGYAVRLAKDNLVALTSSQAQVPDLILIDVSMPDLTGYDMCEKLKIDDVTCDIPILLIGDADGLDKTRIFEIGADDYIPKPFVRHELLRRVESRLEISELRSRLAQKSRQLQQEIGERQDRESTLHHLAERLQILHDIDQSILAAHSSETIAIAAVGRIRQFIPCQRAMVIEISKNTEYKMLAAESSGALSLDPNMDTRQMAFEESALRRGHVLGVSDLAQIVMRAPMQEALYQEGIRAYVIVPLSVQGEIVGALYLETCEPSAFSHEHIMAAIEIGALLAIAIHQVQLYDLAQQEIAERQAAERQLREYNIELEASNAELDAFAHTVAHDLKTPLTALIGFSSLLNQRYERLKPSQLQNGLHTITQNSRKMANIIDELLLLASVRKVEDIETSSLQMQDILDQVETRLSMVIYDKHAEITYPESWPIALGYAPWVEEVWTNYISNAIKYGGSPPRVELGAAVYVHNSTQRDDRTMIRFWVRDNGAGIPPEEQARLFKLFTRLDQVKAEGHGLGLSIVKRIVEKLNGRVGVESMLGQGSTFYFMLPAVD